MLIRKMAVTSEVLMNHRQTEIQFLLEALRTVSDQETPFRKPPLGCPHAMGPQDKNK